MFPSVKVRLNILVIAVHVIFNSQIVLSKPGIDTIRRQYGLSGMIPYNESVVGPVAKVEDSRKQPELRMDTDGWNRDDDYYEYDESMSRSLFPIQEKPSPVQQPPTGKCRVEVLTSSLVRSNARIPPGNGSNAYVSIIETCCEGYEPYIHNINQCVPVCKKPCINGICTRPDVCECFPDHVRSLSGDCIATCPIFCLNGRCHSNGTCTCNPGYIFEPNKMFCVPYCSKDCGEFFNCSMPGTCACVRGYEFNISNMKCEPTCISGCGSGTCVRPNECSCFPGFSLINSRCQANCSRGCERGWCVANDVCACDSGWSLDQTGIKCVPFCPQGCVNSKCTAPGKCTCNEGYKMESGHCKPHCPRGCSNGKCTAPRVCSCRPGYYLSQSGNKCKRLRSEIIVVDTRPEPIFNPVIYVQPNQKSNPNLNLPFAPQPASVPGISAKHNSIHLNQPLFNPPIIAQSVKSTLKPLFNVSLVVEPSAPDNNGNIYDRQPAFNPFFASPQESPHIVKPNYLEQQSAFNPHFSNVTIKTTQKTTSAKMASTTHRTSSRYIKPKTTRGPKVNETTKKILSLFDFFRSPKNSTENQKIWKSTTPKPSCDKACLNGSYVMAAGSNHKCIAHCAKGCHHGTCTAPGHCTCKFGYKKRNNKCIKV